jgi:exonuclease VII small subunit
MASQTTDGLIYRAWKLRIAVALLAFAGALVAWTTYDLGRSNAVSDIASYEKERDQLLERIDELDERNRELERQIAVLERAQQIDRKAYDQVKQEHTGLKQKIQDLNEELAFYRGIMSPTEARTGLRLQDFTVERIGDTDRYHFSLVLTQIKKRHPLARGKVKLYVVGKQGQVVKRLSLADVLDSGQKADSLAYRFRYFQTMEGVLNLPDGFEPATVKVQVAPSGKNAPKKPLEWTFNWPAPTSVDSGAEARSG